MNEEQRLATFPEDFSEICPVPAEKFAAAGFVYEGPGDKVKCVYDQHQPLDEWKKGEDPMEEHARHFPDCSFVTENKQVGEVVADHRAPEAVQQVKGTEIFKDPPFRGPNKDELPDDTGDDEKDDAKKPKS